MEVHSNQYQVVHDSPAGKMRITYVKVVGGEVQSLASFALTEPIDGVPCFNVGYAVKPSCRGRGLGIEVATTGIAELKNGLARQAKGKSFYVEAIVEASNQPSIRVAEALFGGPGEQIVDAYANTPAFHYKVLIQL